MTTTGDRTLETLVGLFILASVAGLVLLAAFGMSGGDWFTEKHRAILVIDDATGVVPGTDVAIAGIPVGSVEAVSLTDDRRVEIRLYVQERYADHVRADSVGRVTMTLSGKIVAIEGGTEEAGPLPEGGALVAGTCFDPLRALEEMELVESLERVEAILEEITALAAQLDLGEGKAPELAAGILTLVEDLTEQRGTMGRLIKDPELAGDIAALVQDLDKTALDLQATAVALERASASVETAGMALSETTDDIERAATSLTTTARSVEEAASGLGETTRRLNDALVELGQTMEAIQRLPLVRGQVRKTDGEGEGTSGSQPD